MTNSIVLYAAPGSCSKVPMILLEEIGESYRLELVRFMRGVQKSPAYLALNPKGKVPLLIGEGTAITENPIIISYLNDTFPEAGLLPEGDAMTRYQQLSDLCFCSSTLHPIVTRIRMPQFFAGAEAMQAVWEKGCESMDEYFHMINKRLQEKQWWYGDEWSAMDAYLYWVFWRVAGANYDTDRFSAFTRHFEAMEQRPSVQKVIAKEAEMQATLKAEGLLVAPPQMIKNKT